MEAAQFRREERTGLVVALGLHLLLVAVLLIQPMRREVLDIPERMTVSLAEEVGLEATAPDPVPESRAAIAPTLAETPAPTIQEPQPQPSAAAVPDRSSVTAPAPRNTPRPTRTPSQQTGGGSRVGSDFLGGAGSSTSTDETRIPASQIGASAKASLRQAINRQLKEHWNAPQGADAEELITVLSFRLNEDGSLAGRPRVVGQSGITDANRPQASLHAERAVRAVQLAAPFDLPPEYYNAWKNISEWRFDRRL